MVIVALPASVTLLTVMSCPLTPTVPVEAVVYPAALDVVDGALQPAGTAIVSVPVFMPPVAAVYVKGSVLPVEPARVDVGATVFVPEPFAAYTVTVGDAAIVVRVPLAMDFCC